MRLSPASLLSLAITSLIAGSAHAAEDFGNLVTQGKVIFDERYRYEYVDQDAAPGKPALDHANAQTLRSRLGVQSGQLYGLSALVEADNVSRIGDAGYNSTRNGQTQYSVVADPDGTEINQALLRYDNPLGNLVAGRQRINLDNQRFIGSVAWRQNEQTFDGGLGQLKPVDGLTLTGAYLSNVNTVFGPDNGRYDNAANPANIEGHSQLFNAQYQWRPELVITGYSYLLGLDNLALSATGPTATQSSQTSGLRLTGATSGFSYALEYANQQDYADNPWALDSDYYLAELGYTLHGVALKGGYEVLEGDGSSTINQAFQTPLATKHAFQGWADVFLTTPVGGVEDAYLGASMPLLGGTAQAVWHDFSSEQSLSTGNDYGSEIDLSYAHPVPGVKGLVALAKYADYNANDFSVDTRKFWLQLQYSL
ncbi:alginate export family protein [Pseudomonas sp. N040]|uniref:alginate export family protein n=1 Tax=Pseudomonas sp. N040 TaxID=2785325 RepID=UPI0018A257FC|nr:alginate export family protein [Pseudomonas sp. N040]MBF7729418.1 alginate export family protein [Pseudomonas sp. N040]MBW7013058.1 alginate export family protein [Pseudomonas sp. N040]